ncbi:MAG: hypothetical protein IPM82_09285 [Saprospiraceae bacterium]|nr:hypothetical protein [Saprospiraceae bacterium]
MKIYQGVFRKEAGIVDVKVEVDDFVDMLLRYIGADSKALGELLVQFFAGR